MTTSNSFVSTQEGLQLWCISGRCFGADDDSVGLHWGVNQKHASDLFRRQTLYLSSEQLEQPADENVDPPYFMVFADQIGEIAQGVFVLSPGSMSVNLADKDGLQLWCISGRCFGDDDDSVGLHWGTNQEDASDLFRRQTLDLSSEQLEQPQDDSVDLPYVMVCAELVGEVANGVFTLDPQNMPLGMTAQDTPVKGSRFSL